MQSFWYRPKHRRGNKAKLVSNALGIRQFDHKWTLPSRLAGNSLPWLIEVDGLVVDARQLPVAIQEVAVQKGLIPYVYRSGVSGPWAVIPVCLKSGRAPRSWDRIERMRSGSLIRKCHAPVQASTIAS